MGFNDINLQVSGPQQPASIYKTKVMKGQVPFAVQVTEPNTKYVIKHNFVLNGDVTIPENCILEFDGGSISGEHTITGQNTGIDAGLVKIFNTDVALTGTWNVSGAYPEWFDNDFEKCADTFERITFTQNYEISKGIVINHYVCLEMKAGTNIKVSDTFTDTYLFTIASNVDYHRSKLYTIDGGGVRIDLNKRACFLHATIPHSCIIVSDVTIVNIGGQVGNVGHSAIWVDNGEITLRNSTLFVSFLGDDYADYTHELIPQYCVSCIFDAIISDVVIVTPKIAIRSLGCTEINNLHVWWGQNQLPYRQGIYTECALELGNSCHNIGVMYADNCKTIFKFINNIGAEGPDINYPTIQVASLILGMWQMDSGLDFTIVDNEKWMKGVGQIVMSSDNVHTAHFNTISYYKYDGEEQTVPLIRFIGARFGSPGLDTYGDLYKHIPQLTTNIHQPTNSVYIKGIDRFYCLSTNCVFGNISYNRSCLHLVIPKKYNITGFIEIILSSTANDSCGVFKIHKYEGIMPKVVEIFSSLRGYVVFKYKDNNDYLDIYINNSIGGTAFIYKNNTNAFITVAEVIDYTTVPNDAVTINSSNKPNGNNFPTFENGANVGFMFFKDGKPYWWNGSAWVDATGTTV